MDNELLRFARLAASVARRASPPTHRLARPAYAPATLFAALLLRERLRLIYRGLEDLLRLSGPPRRAFGLRVVPDHSTVWWFARRRVEPGLLDGALAETVRCARGGAEKAAQVALDSTGLFLSHASRRAARRRRSRPRRNGG